MARPIKNNAEYFSHDADMRNDVKIKALRRKFSHTGYAVWNYILETLTDNDYFEITWEEINIELLAADYDVSVEDLTEIVKYCSKIGLLQLDGDKLKSKTHQNRFAELLSNRTKKSEAGKRGMIKRWGEKDNTVITPLTETITENNKVKESKAKKSKVKDISDDISKENAPIVASSSPSLSPFIPEEKIDLDLLREKCLTSPIWLENAQRALKKSAGEIFTLINSFVSELKAGGRGGEKTEKDFKTHFINWAKLQKDGTNKQSRKQTADERDAEIARQFATGTSLIDKISNSEVII